MLQRNDPRWTVGEELSRMKTQTTDREALHTVNWTSGDVEAAVVRERERCLRIVELCQRYTTVKIIELIRSGEEP